MLLSWSCVLQWSKLNWRYLVGHRYVKVSRRVTNCETNAKKLIPRPILTEKSPKSPGMDFTHPKSRFEHFWDPTQPPSWSKLTMCAKSGQVFLSGQESNPKVWVYRENFNIGNFAHNFFMAFYTCWLHAISFSAKFPMRKFSPSPSPSPPPLSGPFLQK